MIESHVRNANYRIIYRWRFRIKDWRYGDILPLDKAADPEHKYLVQNMKRLSETIAPQKLLAEAKYQYGIVNQNYYRYNNKLYYFAFTTCTDRATDSWACFRASEVGSKGAAGSLGPGFEKWPRNLRTKLRAIPQDALLSQHDRFGKGMAIPKVEFEKHREFFTQFLRSRPSYQEGEYVYAHLKIWFN